MLIEDASPDDNHMESPEESTKMIDRLDQQNQTNLAAEDASTKKTLRQRSTSPNNLAAGQGQRSQTRIDVIRNLKPNGHRPLSNMVLAHEIIFDGNFKLSPQEPKENSLEKQIQDEKLNAFWVSFRSQLAADPPSYTHVVVVVAQVKETLLTLLLPHHGQYRTQILEVLDLDLIRQQAQHHALDIIKLAIFVMDIMSKLCTLEREEDIAKLASLTEPVEICRGILRVLDLMNMDVANLTLQSIRPHLQHHSIEYERKKFEEFLETQQDGLQYTRQWLEEALRKLSSRQRKLERGPGSGELSMPASRSIAASPVVILNHAYIDLLTRNAKDAANFPETMLMDQGRICEMGMQVKKLILVGSILLVTYTNTGAMLSGIQGFPSKLIHNLFILLEGVIDYSSVIEGLSEQVCKEVAECLAAHNFPNWDFVRAEALRSQIRALIVHDSHILSLIDSRVQGFIVEAISAPSSVSPATSIPPGLDMMQAQLLDVTRAFVRLVVHNRSVFGTLYAGILTNIIKGT